MKTDRVMYYLRNPGKMIVPLANKGLFNWMPDDVYLRFVFRGQMGKRLDLNNPKSFNEKLQWLKLHDRKEEYHKLVDKEKIKKIVSSVIGEKYIIPTIGIWNSVEEIPFDKLPNQFVIKCTHDSGSVIICKNKQEIDFEEIKRKLQKCLNKNTYWFGREWPYMGLKPRIIAEEMLGDGIKRLIDYKVLCFNGAPKLIEVHIDRGTVNHTQDFYDTNWERTDIVQTCEPMSKEPMPVPFCLKRMLEFSSILSKDFIHIRVDWYVVDGRLYFGELTFYDGSGFAEFIDEKWDLLLGSWIQIPEHI